MTEHKCLRCNRILKSPKSIELGYGRKCYRIIQLQDEQPEQSNNSVIEELLNRVRKIELDNNFMKHQLKHRTAIIRHPDEDLDWDITPEIKQIKNEYKIEFNVIIKELRVVFGKEEFDYHDVLSPIYPIEEPISPPTIEILV